MRHKCTVIASWQMPASTRETDQTKKATLLKKGREFLWDSGQSKLLLQINMKSKWTLFTFVMHIPGLIVLDSSVHAVPNFPKTTFCLYNLYQNVMTCSATELTFHFGWDSKPNEGENWYHFNQKQLNSSVCNFELLAIVQKSVNSAMQLHWRLLAVYILENIVF